MGPLEPPQTPADAGEASLHCFLHLVHSGDAVGSAMGECPVTELLRRRWTLMKLFHLKCMVFIVILSSPLHTITVWLVYCPIHFMTKHLRPPRTVASPRSCATRYVVCMHRPCDVTAYMHSYLDILHLVAMISNFSTFLCCAADSMPRGTLLVLPQP